MKLVTAKEMGQIEKKTMENYSIDGLLLMENAARCFCDIVEEETNRVAGKKVVIFCGKGGNGGDGYAIGRHLANRGASVFFVTPQTEGQTPDTRKNFDIVKNMGLSFISVEESTKADFDIAIDALFGIGFHGAADGKAVDIIDAINHQNYIAAVDTPSGMDCSTGKVEGPCVKAHLTVTFGLCKVGHFIYPGKEYCGKVRLAEISIPKKILTNFKANFFTLTEDTVFPLPKREENSHKGSFGKLLVFAGSPGMTGAACMATCAALKSGVGMVTVATNRTVAPLLDSRLTEAMVTSLPGGEEDLLPDALTKLLSLKKSQNVLLTGCGLGTKPETKTIVQTLLSQWDKPLVVDADGINCLAGHIDIIENKTLPTVITPHPLEFSRLTGLSLDQITENKLAVAKAFAQDHGIVLVLKGADTLVALPEGTLFVCPNSNSGLAKAGSGDVLAGIIAALLAQGLSPQKAACAGVYLHSRAGLLAREFIGPYSMTATDVIAALPNAFLSAN